MSQSHLERWASLFPGTDHTGLILPQQVEGLPQQVFSATTDTSQGQGKGAQDQDRGGELGKNARLDEEERPHQPWLLITSLMVQLKGSCMTRILVKLKSTFKFSLTKPFLKMDLMSKKEGKKRWIYCLKMPSACLLEGRDVLTSMMQRTTFLQKQQRMHLVTRLQLQAP